MSIKCFFLKIIILVPEYSTTKSIENYLYYALHYIGCSLSCLQYFRNDTDITVSNKQLI